MKNLIKGGIILTLIFLIGIGIMIKRPLKASSVTRKFIPSFYNYFNGIWAEPYDPEGGGGLYLTNQWGYEWDINRGGDAIDLNDFYNSFLMKLCGAGGFPGRVTIRNYQDSFCDKYLSHNGVPMEEINSAILYGTGDRPMEPYAWFMQSLCKGFVDRINEFNSECASRSSKPGKWYTGAFYSIEWTYNPQILLQQDVIAFKDTRWKFLSSYYPARLITDIESSLGLNILKVKERYTVYYEIWELIDGELVKTGTGSNEDSGEQILKYPYNIIEEKDGKN